MTGVSFFQPSRKERKTLNPQRNNTNAIRITLAIALVAAFAALTACGGGGSSDSSSSSTEASANASPLAAMQGTYVAACDGQTFDSGSSSSQVTIIVTAPAGSSEVGVSVQVKGYTGSTDCAASTLDTDVTATGQLSSKSTTKTYTDATGKSVTAKVLTFTYSGVTFSKGSFSGTLPVPGVTTDIAYVLDGSDLYLAKGVRDADGLGDSLSKRVGVKQ